jgi:hypothetical protein
MTNRTSDEVSLLNQRVDEAKRGLLYSGLSCIGLLLLGGIITGITYSMAEPGGTYTATTGLFLVGIITGVVAVWRFVQLLFYLSKRGSMQHEESRVIPSSVDGVRGWKDLD